MLVSDVSFLQGGPAPLVHRYILYPDEGGPLEYVHAATGEAYLPCFGLFDGLLPVAPAGSPTPLFALDDFLGRTLALERASSVGAQFLSSDTGHPVLALDDRVLVSSSRSFRDDGTGRVMDITHIPPRPLDYTYVELDEADYDDMIAAGFNLFRVPAAHLDRVMARPVFFLVHERVADHPELFYRSNYRGGVMYLDEPDVRVAEMEGFEDVVSPEEAGERLMALTDEAHQGTSMYGSRYLETKLAQEGWDLGSRVDRQERGIPSWAGYAGAGWYQMEAGMPSVIQQGRLTPEHFATKVQNRFGVDFPSDAETCIRFLLASATGPARYFGGDWGVSLFGQMEEAAADRLFPLAYERGARFFWVWTSDNGHHVTHDRQLEIVAGLRDWVANDPGNRPRESRPLVALTLPWGYNFGPTNVRGADPGYLWWGSGIRLDDLNEANVPYGEVLAAAYRTYVERVEAGEEVDILYLRAGETPANGRYDAVYQVLPTGWVHRGATAAPDVAYGPQPLPLQIAPNPSSGGTALRFQVQRAAVARMHVYDPAGRLVRTLVPGVGLEEGRYGFWWNGRDDAGARVGSGVYFVRATVGDRQGTRKVVMLR